MRSVFSVCPFSSPLCTDHVSVVRVTPTLHHEPFLDDVQCITNKRKTSGEKTSSRDRLFASDNRRIEWQEQLEILQRHEHESYNSKKKKRCVNLWTLNPKVKQTLISNVSPSKTRRITISSCVKRDPRVQNLTVQLRHQDALNCARDEVGPL